MVPARHGADHQRRADAAVGTHFPAAGGERPGGRGRSVADGQRADAHIADVPGLPDNRHAGPRDHGGHCRRLNRLLILIL